MAAAPPIDADWARWLCDPAEPLALCAQPEPDGPWQRHEFSSRGDRVTARLAGLGGSAGALALVLCEDASAVAPLPGCITATLDLPLLGTRESPKWSERLRACLRDGPASAVDRALLDEFLGQAVRDAQRLLDVCADGLARGTDRIGVAGAGAGALVAAVLSALDARPGAVVLAPGALAAALDPSTTLPAGGDRLRILAGPEPGDRGPAWAAHRPDATTDAMAGDGRTAACQRLSELLA